MSGQTGDQESRTEAPTPRRLQQARDEGDIPVSREAVLLAGLAATALALIWAGDGMGRILARALTRILAQPGLPVNEPLAVFWLVAVPLLSTLACIAMPIALASAAVTLGQTRFALRPKGLRPEFARLSPRQGLRRLFGAENLVETLKSLVKLLIAGGAAALVLRRDMGGLAVLPARPLGLLPATLAALTVRLLLAVVVAQTAVAVADLLWLWRRHEKQLRMSRADVRDEQKETEGDPAVKMRMRRIRIRRARQRMLAAVRTATVVVTNPTHYAVALTYDSGKSTVPRLVAKGVDSMAARIREAAREHRVPIVENPPLARTLHQLPLNARIPPELYRAVAELIAYVWRLSGRRS